MRSPPRPAPAAAPKSPEHINPALLTGKLVPAVWVNPIHRIILAAKQAGDTFAIKHKVAKEGRLPVDQPWEDNRDLVEYRAAACCVEISHQLGVVLPSLVAVQDPGWEYNKIMERSYQLFRDRVTRFRVEKSDDPVGISRGDCDLPEAPEGTDELDHLLQVFLDTVQNDLAKHDVAYLGSGDVRRQEYHLWKSLLALKG
jgi:hypothetical protein